MAEATVSSLIHLGPVDLYTVTGGSNIAAGVNTITFNFSSLGGHYFALRTGTLTAMTVKVNASIDGTNFIDVSPSLIDSSTGIVISGSIASSKYYFLPENLIAKTITVTYERSNSTNAVAFEAMIMKG